MKKIHLVLFSLVWVGFFSLPILQTGCKTAASERVQEVQTLKAVGHTAEAAVQITAQLYRDKKITAEQAVKVNQLYDNKFMPVFRLAVLAAQSNLDSPASPDLVNLAVQLSQLVASYNVNP